MKTISLKYNQIGRPDSEQVSKVSRLDGGVTRVENGKATVLIALHGQRLLELSLDVVEVLLSVDNVRIKGPLFGHVLVDFALDLLSTIAAEVHDGVVLMTVVNGTLGPGFAPVGSLLLHQVSLVNTHGRQSNHILLIVMTVVASKVHCGSCRNQGHYSHLL